MRKFCIFLLCMNDNNPNDANVIDICEVKLCFNCVIFLLDITLTEKGWKEYNYVLQKIYEYIK